MTTEWLLAEWLNGTPIETLAEEFGLVAEQPEKWFSSFLLSWLPTGTQQRPFSRETAEEALIRFRASGRVPQRPMSKAERQAQPRDLTRKLALAAGMRQQKEAQKAFNDALDADDAEAEAAAAGWRAEYAQALRGKLYNGGARIAILAAFKAKPEFDADAFFRQIESLAATYLLPNGVAVLSGSKQGRDRDRRRRARERVPNQAKALIKSLKDPSVRARLYRTIAASVDRGSTDGWRSWRQSSRSGTKCARASNGSTAR